MVSFDCATRMAALICIHFVSKESLVPDEVRLLTYFSLMELLCVCIKHEVIAHRISLLFVCR